MPALLFAYKKICHGVALVAASAPKAGCRAFSHGILLWVFFVWDGLMCVRHGQERAAREACVVKTERRNLGSGKAAALEGKEIQEALVANDTFVIHGMECLRREEQSDREKETLDRAKRINIAVLDACVII